MRDEVETFNAKQLARSTPGLAQISDPAWLAAIEAAHVMRLPDGASMTLCSDEVDHFGIVLEGSLKVRARSDDGRIFSIYRVRPGEMCMLSLAFMSARNRVYADVAGEGDVQVLRIPSIHFERLLTLSPGFREFVMGSMSGYVIKMLSLVEEVTFERLQTRIERHLEDVVRASGSNQIRVTHQELAHELGSTREVISRLLKTMEKAGNIDLGRGTIKLLSPINPVR
ncbi:MAG: hypothetical protein COW59_11260 [Lysobacterales bacterium CG17_big_fil_post_rev_8_21_14_2_50_64_11]|nr:MAG: hypothetical protein COW59_11260 [Xanthomonadales bacterium CG17_big_fil_post_rev_8_21_14_2_50_64_11]PIX61277.1 MAG: hypothetical protein COZ47_02800 [Xanthomonadales bacterium CG_4_10_14_3_um_filter_64_11]